MPIGLQVKGLSVSNDGQSERELFETGGIEGEKYIQLFLFVFLQFASPTSQEKRIKNFVPEESWKISLDRRSHTICLQSKSTWVVCERYL